AARLHQRCRAPQPCLLLGREFPGRQVGLLGDQVSQREIGFLGRHALQFTCQFSRATGQLWVRCRYDYHRLGPRALRCRATIVAAPMTPYVSQLARPGPMTTTHDSESVRSARWLERLRRMRLLLATAIILFAGLWTTGELPGLPALAGFVLIVAAALIATGGPPAMPPASPRDAPPAPPRGQPLVQAGGAG